MSQRIDLFQGSDMALEVANLKNKLTGELVTGATVTASIFDAAGDAVSGAGNPITLAEITGFDGLYRGTLPDAAVLVIGDLGTIVYTASGGAGLAREWTLEYVVRGVQ